MKLYPFDVIQKAPTVPKKKAGSSGPRPPPFPLILLNKKCSKIQADLSRYKQILVEWYWSLGNEVHSTNNPKNSTSVSDDCAFLCQSDRKNPDVSAISPTPPWGP